jgi:hypothetical protein
MNEFHDQLIFTVDFNNVGDDGRLVKGALERRSSLLIPEVGAYVILHDPEGNRCCAWIERIQGPLAFFRLDDATWVSGEEVQATGVPTPEPYSVVG